MAKNIIISIVIVIVVVLGGYYLFSKPKSQTGDNYVNLSYNPDAGLSTTTPSTTPASPVPVTPTPETTTNNKKIKMITIETIYGKIVFETYNSDAPNTVNNFATLAGKGFYDNLTFHRVIKGFMIQG